MIARINVVTLGVTDMPRSRKFYEQLGWVASSSSNEHFTVFRPQGCALALYPMTLLAEDATVKPEGHGFRGVALAQNVPTKGDVKMALDAAVAAGGTVKKPAQDVFWGGHSGYFADPDGHLWEVAWNPHWRLTPDGMLEIPV